MEFFILPFLLFVGAWADPQQTTHTLQDYSEFANYSDHGSASVFSPDQQILQSNQEHGDKVEIANESLDQFPVNILIQEDSNNASNTVCHHPFENIGDTCFYFSDDLRTFSEAQEYCEILSHAHISQVSMAMLEYSDEEDIALLNAVAERETLYWIGAKSDDSVNWHYVDDRVVNMQAPFWYLDEPNHAVNKCITVQNRDYGNLKKAYLYDSGCEESLNFICQTGCPTDFQRLGNYCYLQSIDIGLPALTWPKARDFCQSVAVPEGYHSDLAVLGLQERDNYQLMTTFASENTVTVWIGGYTASDCVFQWTDERIITSSSYWYHNEPDCEITERVLLHYYSGYNRVWLYGYPETYEHPFVCQMFTNV